MFLKLFLSLRVIFRKSLRNYVHYTASKTCSRATFENKSMNAYVYLQSQQHLFATRKWEVEC